MKVKTILFSTILFFVCVTFSWGGTINEAAPAFSLKDLYGKTISLNDFHGSVVFINFWASWCAPCRQELPALNRFIDKYKSGEAVVLAINVDKKRSNVDEFLDIIPGLSKNLYVLLDPGSNVIAGFKARAMPTSFVIDKTGIIRHVHFGFKESDPQLWVKEVEGLLR